MAGRGSRSRGGNPGGRSQGRIVSTVAIGIFAVGALFLIGLGIYAYFKYFSGGGGIGAQTPTSLADQMVTRTAAAVSGETLPPPTKPAATRDQRPTATPTAVLDATATAACSLLQLQFPGTPCPAVAVPGIEATATAACIRLQSEFPGTPCP